MQLLLGPGSTWGPTEYLVALLVDQTAAANWQRAGKKNAPKPKPIPRPGVVDPTSKKVAGRTRLSMADVDAQMSRWSTPREGRTERALPLF